MILWKNRIFLQTRHIDLSNEFYLVRFDIVFDFIWIFETDTIALENCDFGKTTKFTKLFVVLNKLKKFCNFK